MTQWGSWIDDPLDLKCIRLDAELEERAKREREAEGEEE